MIDKICYIIGAGEFFCKGISPNEGDYVIAADGGYDHLKGTGIKIDLAIGDFDSAVKVPVHPNMTTLEREKDETDMQAAINYGYNLGYRIFHIYGGTGGRFDHTFANVQCLCNLSSRQARGYLFDKNNIITAITDEKICFDENYKGYISVYSNSDKAEGVYEKGLKYYLDNAIMLNNFPTGVSNEFIGVASEISVRKGTLVIIYEGNSSQTPLKELF